MKLIFRLRLLILILAVGVGACSSETEAPSHKSYLNIPAAQYSPLLENLDQVAAQYGLTRYGADSDLSKLHGREILFWVYQDRAKSKSRWALLVTDLDGEGRVRIEVYRKFFDGDNAHQIFVSSVNGLLQQFGGVLQPQ